MARANSRGKPLSSEWRVYIENEWDRRLVKLSFFSFPYGVLKTWAPEAAPVCRLSLGNLVSKPQHSGEGYKWPLLFVT